jgi:hypothetical protein
MNTLWTFGDSYTFGAGCRFDSPIYLSDGDSSEYYDNYKTEYDDIWPVHLGKMLNLEVKNFGRCGASNDYIIDSVIDNWDFIQENDVVIIGITFHNRIDTPYGDTLESPYFDKDTTEKDTPYSKEEFETLVNFHYYFTNNSLYKHRFLKRFKFLEKLLLQKNIKTYLWNVTTFTTITRFEKISTATNNKICDQHFSFTGHRNFADMMHKKITTETLI